MEIGHCPSLSHELNLDRFAKERWNIGLGLRDMSKFDYRLRRLEEAAGLDKDADQAFLDTLTLEELLPYIAEIYAEHFEHFKKTDREKARRYGNLADWHEHQASQIPEEKRPSKKRMEKIRRAVMKQGEEILTDRAVREWQERFIRDSDNAEFELVWIDQEPIFETILASELAEFAIEDDEGDAKPIAFAFLNPPPRGRGYHKFCCQSPHFPPVEHSLREHHHPFQLTEQNVAMLWKGYCYKAYWASQGQEVEPMKPNLPPPVISAAARPETGSQQPRFATPSGRSNGHVLNGSSQQAKT